MLVRLTLLLLPFVLIASDAARLETMVVTATAYNSLASQTTFEGPDITAWGDKLKPGMKCIAVSRDLLSEGLKYNTEVEIEGFEGVYLVKDKMHKRWTRRIDIYMGNDLAAAREWGVRQVKIKWYRQR